MEYVTIGKIVNAVGIHGDVKCYPYSDFIEDHLVQDKSLFLWNEITNQIVPVTLTHTRIQGTLYVLHFEQIQTMTQAEGFKQWWVQILKEDQVKLPKGAFYFPELMGCQVIDSNGQLQGTVSEILDYGFHAILRVKKANRNDVLIPFVDVYINKVEIKEKKILIKEVGGLFDGD